MSAEGNPPEETSFMSRPLEIITRYILRAPVGVLSICGGLALLSILLTINGLAFKSSRLDLLNPHSSYNKRWLNYLAEFGDRDDAVIVVQSEDPANVQKTVDDLARRIAEKPDLFESLLYRQDLAKIRGKGLQLVAEQLSEAQLTQLTEGVVQASAAIPLHPAQDPTDVLRTLNKSLSSASNDSISRNRSEEQYIRFVMGLMPAITPEEMMPPDAKAQLAQLTSPTGGLAELKQIEPRMQELGVKYFTSHNDRIGFLLVRFIDQEGEAARGKTGLLEMRKILESARAAHPKMWIGLTGMPVIEQDEMEASQIDMVWTNVLSLAGVSLLFVAGFGGLRHAGLAVLTLLVGMMWSFGYVTLVVGHLNILSAAFGVILIGLGIDFGIHYVASYLRLRQQGGLDCEQALITTAAEVGPGILTGGVTTAAAFFMAALTEFTGVRELGVVAGGGILLCVLAAMIFLPPLIFLTDRNRPVEALPQILSASNWFRPLMDRPRVVIVLSLGMTAYLAMGATKLYYDHNLLNLQPKHIESVDIERALFTKSDDSVWFAVSICKTRDEVKSRKAEFDKFETVAKTEEIVTLLPQVDSNKLSKLSQLQNAIEPLAIQTAHYRPTPIDVEAMEQELVNAQAALSKLDQPNMQVIGAIEQMLMVLAQYPQVEAGQRITAYREQMLNHVALPLAKLAPYADASPIGLADLPQPLADRFIGKNSQHLLKIYAKGNIWDMDSLRRFVTDVESVDPQATGHPIQTFYASQHMQQSYLHAGMYALVAVAALLMLDFRSIGYTLLAMLPLTMGFVQLCGTIGWLNIPFNPANMIVLPLILGIGVDDGVHLVHEFRRQRGSFQLSDSTATALLLTSSTTMASFGSMILARHQGLRSLGQVLCLGVLFCLFCSVVVFPCLLRWMTRNKPVLDEAAPEVT